MLERKSIMLFTTLTAARDPRFSAAYEIYRNSIVVREQKSEAELVSMLAKPEYCFVLAEQGHNVIGFAILFTEKHGSLGLLEYMAVDENYRGTGVGSALFQESIRILRKQQRRTPMLLEVDSDQEATSDSDPRKRRQNFYRRLGCRRVLGCAYILPLPSKTPPPEMDLLIHLSDSQQSIARATLLAWLQVIYTDVYGCRANDRRPAMIVSGVNDPVELA